LLGVKAGRSLTVDQALTEAYESPISFFDSKVGDNLLTPSVILSIRGLMGGAFNSRIWLS